MWVFDTITKSISPCKWRLRSFKKAWFCISRLRQFNAEMGRWTTISTFFSFPQLLYKSFGHSCYINSCLYVDSRYYYQIHVEFLCSSASKFLGRFLILISGHLLLKDWRLSRAVSITKSKPFPIVQFWYLFCCGPLLIRPLGMCPIECFVSFFFIQEFNFQCLFLHTGHQLSASHPLGIGDDMQLSYFLIEDVRFLWYFLLYIPKYSSAYLFYALNLPFPNSKSRKQLSVAKKNCKQNNYRLITNTCP